MPLPTRFWPYQSARPPDLVGCYELGRGGYVLYVGSGRIRERVQCHARDQDKHFQQYRCLITNDRRRAKQIERQQLLTFGSTQDELPLYNSEIPHPP
jgi:hypothetical protein